MDLITSHLNADFDALASAMAAKRLYPEAVIVMPGSMEKKVREFLDIFNPVALGKMKDIHLEEVTRLIIVDTKHPDRIGPLKELLSRPGVKVHVYDHHPRGPDDIRGELEVIDTVGAVSTIFTELLQKKKILITPMEATALCLGIYEETGSLLFSSTTPRDLMAASHLLKRGANLKVVSDLLKVEMSKEEVSLLNALVGSLREVLLLNKKIKIGKATMEGFGDVAHLAHTVMDMEDMDALFLLIGMADKIFIVARSKAPELDVAQVVSEFGGGGHPSAASATIKDMPLELVEERVIESCRKHIRPVKAAKDIMTTPVVVIQWDQTIKEAEDMLTRYGVNVLPVVKQAGYFGILTREVVEKALFHGFGKSRCADFATTDAITVTPDAPLSEVEAAMVEQNQRFVPVLDGNRVRGAITRTDIMRSLYEDLLRKSRMPPPESGGKETPRSIERNVTTLMKEQLPPDIFEFLVRAGDVADTLGFGAYLVGGCVRDLIRSIERNVITLMKEQLPPAIFEFLVSAGEVADSLGFGAYLVGGCVRDLIRREENLDIDVVVEGDGIAFARNLAEQMAAKVTVHQRFGTATVVKGDFKLDIATSRTEYYESPATLPKVETSSIKKDLYRRDFTINSLAVKLNKRDFGRLIDFFGGQRDLKDRVIRVLHNLSFVEDPTRAFRAIRFSERFGFKLTRHTENLIKLAMKMNIFERLSGTRIYDELSLTFKETNPVKALKRLGDYDLLRVIHPRLTFSPELEALLQSVHDTTTWFDLLFLQEHYHRGMIFVMALLNRLSDDEREDALRRLAVSDQVRQKVVSGLRIAQEVLRNLRPDNPVATYHLLKELPLEATLFAMSLTKNSEKKRAVSHYLLDLRYVAPSLKGEDLKRLGIPPGPLYSKIFGRILDEKLCERLPTKQEELDFVRKLIAGSH